MKISVKFSRKSIIAASVITTILVIATAASIKQFTKLSPTYGIVMYILSIMASVIVGIVTAVSFELPEKADKIVKNALFFLLPFASMFMTEILNSVFIYDFEVIIFIGNYIFYLMLQGLFYAVIGRFRVSLIAFNSLTYLLALTNNLVYSFRGTVFLPSDILGIKTAANVAGTYTYSLTATIIMATIVFVFIIVVSLKIVTPWMHKKRKVVGRSVAAAFFAVVCCVYFFTDIFAQFNIKPDFWNQSRGYHNGGFLPCFCLNIKYLYYSKPNGYDSEKIDDIMYEVIADPYEIIESEGDGEITEKPDEKNEIYIPRILSVQHSVKNYLSGIMKSKKKAQEVTPNIICIMNESLSDLSVLGNFETNIDYMPFLRGLTENTVKGNLYVPVNGAGTSNSEFEFLTGCSTSFLPTGSNAYMSYIKNKTPSLVSTLSACGYSKLAFHPYYSSGWNRTSVYHLFGFERFKSIGSVLPDEVMEEYSASGNKPEVLISATENYFNDSTVLLRQYVSDSYNYKTLISEYEKRDMSKPFFAFNITMQNHGGYEKEYSNFSNDVYVTSSEKEYPKTNQYLSLMKHSDDAFKELIEYFQSIDEPTIICMFGDHQPSIENEFLEEVLGKKLDDLTNEELQKRYITPFYIWANYDVEEKVIDKLSVNYLSTYLLKMAGVELPVFNEYLYTMSTVLPVIDTVGYVDKDGNYYSYDALTKYSDLLNNYKYIQYNMLSDKQNRHDSLFYLDSFDTSDFEDVTLDSEKSNDESVSSTLQ